MNKHLIYLLLIMFSMVNANPYFSNCNNYGINTDILGVANWGPDPPSAGDTLEIQYSVKGLPRNTTDHVYVVAAVIKNDRIRDPVTSNKVKVDQNVKDVSVSLNVRWPSPADKYNIYSLIVYLVDYKWGTYSCSCFYDRWPH
ncbi:hypothetical protein C2G38_2099124 [Gigaspora rosea]|uniref:Reelin domain-containing protein n=1 Tax=Gigaspora rosea TaxID=44941 RepID=A0A397USE0_9GLOM|nr:hypothetical protein C2G38_2099124 [Gigaspora rosea]